MGKKKDSKPQKKEPEVRLWAGDAEEGESEEQELDVLTDLYANVAVRQRIINCLQKAPEEMGVFLIIDLDDFKSINETYGRIYGDAVLKRIAGMISRNFKANDVVGRIGGDEFVVYCHNINSEANAISIVERLFTQKKEFLDLKDNNELGCSIGVAFYPRDGKTFDELFHSADLALYLAKRNGKDTYSIYSKNANYNVKSGEIDTKQKNKGKNEEINKPRHSKINKELFDFAFEVVSRSENFSDAVETIFSEIGLYFDLDRITLLEYNTVHKKVEMSASWRREEDGNDSLLMQEGSNDNWKKMEQFYFDKHYFIFKQGLSFLPDFVPNKEQWNKETRSAIQFPIMDTVKLAGCITFDVWRNEKKWGASEINTLSSITKMISSYILRRQIKEELETEIVYASKAMDVQKLAYYAIDAATHKITYLSRYAGETFTGIENGRTCYEVLRGFDKPCVDCPINGCSETVWQNSVEIYESKDDKWHTITAARLDKEQEQYLLCTSDVTAFLERVKGIDQLTGLLSYDKFRTEALKRISNREKSYVAAFLGIQDFPRINDEYGYEIGDEVLRTLSQVVSRKLADSELFCRVKGDDYVILLEQNHQWAVEERLVFMVKPLAEIMRSKYPNMQLNCFCGLYAIRQEDLSISGVIDKAMKARKVALENYYELNGIYEYTAEYEARELETKQMERCIREALDDNRFQVYFQPKVNVFTGKVVGAEALVRLVGTDQRIISPGRFIPLAEKNGLIVEIDNYVYEKTFQYIKEWEKQGKTVPKISVNMSRLHLFHDDLPEYMESLNKKYHLKAKHIELEITESIFFEDKERLVSMIKKLNKIGYSISMDDFGAGFSTLSLMTTLPIDTLKVDGSFFMDTAMDEKNKAVIISILQLARNLQFDTVIEGVETQEQIDFLKEHDGEVIQGFYYYKPMPAEEFAKMLE